MDGSGNVTLTELEAGEEEEENERDEVDAEETVGEGLGRLPKPNALGEEVTNTGVLDREPATVLSVFSAEGGSKSSMGWALSAEAS